MKASTRRLFALLTLSAAVLSAASCGDTGKTPAGGKDTAAVGESGEDTESLIRNLSSIPKDLDFDGAVFNIASRQTAQSVDFENLTGDIVEDSVYTRNRMAEDYLNVRIVDMKSNDCDLTEFGLNMQSGDQIYSAAMTHITKMTVFLQSGYFYNLDEVPYLDLSKPYWVSGVTDSLEVLGKKYLFAGDISIRDNTNIWCIFFNKNILNNLDLESPYKALSDGRWTLDYFAAQVKEGASDLNGDGKWTWESDQFGLMNPTETLCGMFNIMGRSSVKRDAEGKMVCNIDSTDSMEAMVKISDWAKSGRNTIFLESSQIPTEDPWGDLRTVFIDGRSLYYLHTVNIVEYLRDMNDEFGILPLPKFDEAQEKYLSATQEWGQCVYGIPVSAPNVEMSGAVLEYLGGISTDTLRSAYYDVALTRKYSRDDESVQSLDILFNNIVIDLGFSFFGDIRWTISQALSDGSTIASMVASQKKAIEAGIAKTEAAVEDID